MNIYVLFRPFQVDHPDQHDHHKGLGHLHPLPGPLCPQRPQPLQRRLLLHTDTERSGLLKGNDVRVSKSFTGGKFNFGVADRRPAHAGHLPRRREVPVSKRAQDKGGEHRSLHTAVHREEDKYGSFSISWCQILLDHRT